MWNYGYMPGMIDSSYNILGGDTNEGQFIQQWLSDKKNSDQPGSGTPPGGSTSAPIGHRIALKSSASGYYVSNNLSDNETLEARWATTPNTWEYFDVVDAGNGLIALKSEATGYYVTANLNVGSDVLIADHATSVRAWEQYTWVDLGTY